MSLEKACPDVSSSETLNKMAPELQGSPSCDEHDDRAGIMHITTLIRHKQKFEPKHRIYLRNDLLLIVGYLEFFNALDFPANIWNTIPTPTFAVGLMAAGGSIALIASSTAFIDLRRSWCNIISLAAERSSLQRLCRREPSSSVRLQYFRAWLSLNFREYGWELIDRSLMDALVGFAAVLVGIGTLMAIGGANPKVFLASNLLSGYIGNGFVALYSLVNAVWSGYLYIRARHHKRLARNFIAEPKIRRRAVHNFRQHQFYAVLNGTTLVVSGTASLLTSKFWWGYVMLIPCVASSIFCNILWRKKIGYNRVLSQFLSPDTLEFDIYSALRNAIDIQDTAQEASAIHEKLALLPSAELVDFMHVNGMLQELCVHIGNNASLCKAAGIDPTRNEINIERLHLENMDHEVLLGAVQTVVNDFGKPRFRDRERYLFELLGTSLSVNEQLPVKVCLNEENSSEKIGRVTEQNAEKHEP